ncbi:hypothetical protein ARMGADRAFT_1144595 [Armillaria gallica]|uniref:Uncharacterized protein n=1 Tax=Armillaria gallica TaxID=47427 RepID=A0A2H3CIY3_ARMGA|nr:hypothetical protein ARMGADRAFT_1144595 [Armillaria gallica]
MQSALVPDLYLPCSQWLSWLSTLHTLPSSFTSTPSPAPCSAASVQKQDQPSLLSILEDFIERNYNFGTAYALLCLVWNTENSSNIQDELRRHEGEDREHRQKALVGNLIVNPDLTPQHVWDLYSNHVALSWIIQNKTPHPLEEWPTLISHAWVDEKDHVDVWTPINGKEWPVPIPKDVDLNLIRIEMLNLRADNTKSANYQRTYGKKLTQWLCCQLIFCLNVNVQLRDEAKELKAMPDIMSLSMGPSGVIGSDTVSIDPLDDLLKKLVFVTLMEAKQILGLNGLRDTEGDATGVQYPSRIEEYSLEESAKKL